MYDLPLFLVVVRSNLTSYTFIIPLFSCIKISYQLGFKSSYNSVCKKLLLIMEERIKLNVDGGKNYKKYLIFFNTTHTKPY